MAQGLIEIGYVFRCDDGMVHSCLVAIDPVSLERVNDSIALAPEWTALDIEKCPHCPLSSDESPSCPAALSFAEMVDKCNSLLSYSEVDVTVHLPERTVTRRCSAQKGLSSLLGLLMATSGCPTMALLKPLARFHQPFASRDETMFRAASVYLLAQYFRNNEGKDCDLSLQGLQEIYTALHVINVHMARRLRTVTQGDAHLNAIVLLDLFAQELPVVVEDKLAAFGHLFQPYLDSPART